MASKPNYKIESQIAEGMEDLLADAVREHPILYAEQSQQRSKTIRRELELDAWKHISDELNLDLYTYKLLWLGIVQKLKRHVDNSETCPKKWEIYENLLELLDEHIERRKSRYDICKQIRNPLSSSKLLSVAKSSPNSSTYNENEYSDDVESAERNEIADEKKDILVKKIQNPTKRLSSNNATITLLPKEKLKIDLVQENEDKVDDEEIFPVIEALETMKIMENIKEIEPNDTIDLNKSSRCGDRDKILEAIVDNLTRVVAKSLNLVEKCVGEFANQDSNEIFGTVVTSLIRDLSPDQRIKVQFEIIQFTDQLVQRELNK